MLSPWTTLSPSEDDGWKSPGEVSSSSSSSSSDSSSSSGSSDSSDSSNNSDSSSSIPEDSDKDVDMNEVDRNLSFDRKWELRELQNEINKIRERSS